MGTFADRLRTVALALGAPGLFLIAFLDSSFLSLPEFADIIVVYMVTRHKSRALVYVIAATTGSLAGCLIMYYIGRKGGEALIRRRFTTANADRAMAAVRRHGVMAVLIPAMLPPPMPFKIFVLLAGVVGISPARFSVAVVTGRSLRFSLLAVLAIEYGDRALAYMRDNALVIAIVTLGLLAAGFAAYVWWSKAGTAETR